MQKNDIVVAVVHIGAGGYLGNYEREKQYKRLIRKSLKAIKEKEKEIRVDSDDNNNNNNNNIDYHFNKFLKISKILEDSKLTNTGYGSCICNDGSVRCDSCVHHISDKFNEIGCVICNSSRYPIKDSIKVLKQRIGLNDYGKNIFKEYGVIDPIVKIGCMKPDDTLVSKEMRKMYENISHINDRIDNYNPVQDTIGVLLYEKLKNGEVLITIGSSSGGNMLRESTRIGSAGVVGSGCWVEKDYGTGETVCVMASGQGENIIKNDMSRSIAKYVLQSIKKDPHGCLPVQSAIEEFNNKRRRIRKNIGNKGQEKEEEYYTNINIGIIGIYINSNEDKGVLFYIHDTHSFVFGNNTFVNSSSKIKTCLNNNNNNNNSSSSSCSSSIGYNNKLQHGQWPLF